MHTYVAFFDLDNTLLDTSSGRLFIDYSYSRNLISHRELVSGMFTVFIHRLGLWDTERVVRRWIMKYRGWPEKRLVDFSRQFFSDVVRDHFRRGVREALDFHRKRRGRTVILSASMMFICDPVREHFMIDDSLCSSLEVENGLLTGHLAGSYCYGVEKLRRAESYCRSNGFNLSDSFYYADSASDLPLLEKVGNPVCVSPVSSLRKHALKKGWAITDLD
jgi:HAD superfamily hydrolase (TIGR01490 family)